MTHSRIGFRTRLLLTVVGSVAATVVVAVGAFYLLLGQRLDADATALAKANATAELSTLEMQDGRLVARENGDEQSLDSRLWVFAGGRAIDAPPASTELSRVATSLAGAPEGVSDLREETRFYALPVVVGGARRGTVVAAIALAPVRADGTRRARSCRRPGGRPPRVGGGHFAVGVGSCASSRVADDGRRVDVERARPRATIRSR